MKIDIPGLLENLNVDRISDRELDHVYLASLEIARKHIVFLDSVRGSLEGNKFFSNSLEDEAQTYIARLFTPVRETGRLLFCELWKKYNETRLRNQMDPEEYMEMMVRSIVTKQRNDVMRFHQPQEYKAYRSIRSAINSTDGFEIVKNGRTNHIARTGVVPVSNSCASYKILLENCLPLFGQSTNVYQLAKKSLRLFDNHDFQFQCIRLDHLYNAILTHLTNHYNQEQKKSHEQNTNPLGHVVESAILSPTSDYISSIIDSQYLQKGKISASDAGHLKAIMESHLNDLFSTGTTDTVKSYVDFQCPFGTRGAFLRNHKNKIYYLINLQKQKLEMLADELLGHSYVGNTETSAKQNSISQQAK